MRTTLKILIAILLLIAILAFYISGGADLVNLGAIKSQQQHLTELFLLHPWVFGGLFFLAYVLITALSLPVATFLTLLAGAIFGFGSGLLLVSFASTIGAALAFLMSRFVLRDVIQNRYAETLSRINEGFHKEGLFYIFALRLVPVFPFFLVNLVLGVMPVSLRHFYLLSQLGMLPGTAVYVYAGTQLGQITNLRDITSPELLLAFSLLGLFPLITKKLLDTFRK